MTDFDVLIKVRNVNGRRRITGEEEMGKKYIDANKVADELSKVRWYKREDEKQAIRIVKEFPSADVVEVVRCADCKYQDKGENDCEAWNLCGYRPSVAKTDEVK